MTTNKLKERPDPIRRAIENMHKRNRIDGENLFYTRRGKEPPPERREEEPESDDVRK